jgi:hypothetical protein
VPRTPDTRSRRQFSTPAAAWVTQNEPRAPLSNRSSRPGVVVDETVGHDVADLGGDLGDLEAGDEPDQVVGVGADVADHERRPAPNGVVAPGERTVGVGVALGRLAALHVLDLDQLELAELTVGDHRPRLADHRVPGVVVGQAEHETGLLDAAATSAASASVLVIGLSQITSKPCRSAADRVRWWLSFGVMIATTSAPSGRA